MKRFSLFCSLLIVPLLVACSSVPPTPDFRTSTPGGGGLVCAPNAAHVTLYGEARDGVTLKSLPAASIVITTTTAVVSFTGAYSVTVPGESVVTFHAEAEGYRPLEFSVCPHYARDVSISAPLNFSR